MTEAALPLDDQLEVKRRLTLLDQPHVKTLTQFVERLRAMGYGTVPNVDPLDGGINARILFLLEKPGKRTVDAAGFISRDNASQSAKYMRRFMDEAGIDRTDTLLWNIVPGWNGTTAIRAAELTQGVAALNELITFLPKLAVVVCVGRRAQSVQPLIAAKHLTFFHSYHPSPNNFAAAYEKWLEIPQEWRKAQSFLQTLEI